MQGTAEKLAFTVNQIFQQYQQSKKTFKLTIPYYEDQIPFPYKQEVKLTKI